MASSISRVFFSLVLASSLFISGVLGGITCEKLCSSTCAFAVSSFGSRCVLEKHVRGSGGEELSCRNSGVEAAGFAGWVETDECVAACGLNRETVGISSDLLMDRQFMNRLCSPECYQGCPNVIDLYYNLAAGEGVFLPNQCAVLRSTAPVATVRKLISSTFYGGGSAPPPELAATGRKLITSASFGGDSLPQPPTPGRKLIDYGYYYGGDSAPPPESGRKLIDYGYYYGGDSAPPPEAGRKLIDYGYYYGGDSAPPPEPERKLEEYGYGYEYGYGNAQPPL